MGKSRNSKKGNSLRPQDIVKVDEVNDCRPTKKNKKIKNMHHIKRWGIPSLFFLATIASILFWLPDLIGGEDRYWTKQSFVIRDVNKKKHYIGEGNEIKILDGRYLVHGCDTVEVGDSVYSELIEKYVSKDSCFSANPFDLYIENNDTIIVAELDSDSKLSGVSQILYARKGERFLIIDSTASYKDSLQFDGKRFFIGDNKVKIDTVVAEEYNKEIPFEIEFFVQEEGQNEYSIMLSDSDSGFKRKLLSPVRVYTAYGDSALCSIQSTDSLCVMTLTDNTKDFEDRKFRLTYDKHLSYVLSAKSAAVVTVSPKSLGGLKVVYYLLTIILFISFVASIIYIFIYLRKKQNQKEQERQKTIDEIEELVKEIEELKSQRMVLPDSPDKYKDWFEGLDSSKGDKGLYNLSELCLKDWYELYVYSGSNERSNCEKQQKIFEERIEAYIASIEEENPIIEIITEKENRLKELKERLETLDGEEVVSKDEDGITTHHEEVEETVESLKKILDNYSKELNRLKKVERIKDEEIRKAKEKAEQKANDEIRKAERRVVEANERALKAEKRADNIRQEVTDQFESEIREKNRLIEEKQETLDKTRDELKIKSSELRSKEQECNALNLDLSNANAALDRFTKRITDVPLASNYAKSIEKLLAIAGKIEDDADKLLDKGIDVYLLTKYMARYQKALHQIDMHQFAADVLNIANVQFVYKEQQIAKYSQKDEKQFKESMKIFFFETYLGKYINALMVFNETMAGVYHLVEGLDRSDTKMFEQYRVELQKIFAELEIEVHSVKIFDSILDNVDLSVKLAELDFDCASGTICQIDSCIVYLKGGNKPENKIRVIAKQ